MLYIVRVRSMFNTITRGKVIGYLARGKMVKRKPNATPYDSPSSAERAAKAFLKGSKEVYCTIGKSHSWGK
jgi:hypothetical protein